MKRIMFILVALLAITGAFAQPAIDAGAALSSSYDIEADMLTASVVPYVKLSATAGPLAFESKAKLDYNIMDAVFGPLTVMQLVELKLGIMLASVTPTYVMAPSVDPVFTIPGSLKFTLPYTVATLSANLLDPNLIGLTIEVDL